MWVKYIKYARTDTIKKKSFKPQSVSECESSGAVQNKRIPIRY